MSKEKIIEFLKEHHVLTLATCNNSQSQCSSLFYTFLEDEFIFIVASDESTEHIQNVFNNELVSGTVVLETKEVGKIQGIQYKALMSKSDNGSDKLFYLKRFPYAVAMKLTLWRITLLHVKLTDNRLGFGKKLFWQR